MKGAPVPKPHETGWMFRQNLPSAKCEFGYVVDHNLSPGTLEVWHDGRILARVEGIGLFEKVPIYPAEVRTANFRADLQSLINVHSREAGSNTPDFILAEYLMRCMDAFDGAVKARTHWYGEEKPEAEVLSGDGSPTIDAGQNIRTETNEEEDLECPNCGFIAQDYKPGLFKFCPDCGSAQIDEFIKIPKVIPNQETPDPE